MRIPVYYIIIGVIVISAIWITRNKMAGIGKEAENKSRVQYSQDIKAYKESVRNIKDAQAAVKHGWRFLQSNDSQRAEAVLARAAELDKNYRDANVYLGYAKLKTVVDSNNQGQVKGIKLTPEEKVKQVNKAKEILLAAQKLDPLFPLTNKLLGMISEQFHNDKEASLWYARYNELTTHN